jgi:hypothetical protein
MSRALVLDSGITETNGLLAITSVVVILIRWADGIDSIANFSDIALSL